MDTDKTDCAKFTDNTLICGMMYISVNKWGVMK